jgi:hypothetical protein
MVVRYKDRTLVVLDKPSLLRAENHIDGILRSPSRGVIFSREGIDGRELAIELPVFLGELERNYLVTLYRSHGWPGVECETFGKRKQNIILKL